MGPVFHEEDGQIWVWRHAGRGRPPRARPIDPQRRPATKTRAKDPFSVVGGTAGPGLGRVCDFLRGLITSLDPARVEVVWPRQRIASFGVGPRKMREHYAYISVHSSHVNLGFYHGAVLRDPSEILEGTGKRLRHVKLQGLAGARIPAVRRLLAEAISERRRALA